MENIKNTYNVSRETIERLKAYEASLHEWQQKLNLVSNASLQDAWNRHFEDSLQLLPLVPEDAEILYDFGSGAGFPGMVLAIALADKTPYLKVKLIESIKKKTVYLNAVAELSGLSNVEILNDRIENLPAEKADVITSRAMCSLAELLNYSFKFCSSKTKCLFLKGKKYPEEITEARKNWNFNCEVIQSKTSEDGAVLVITGISRKRR